MRLPLPVQNLHQTDKLVFEKLYLFSIEVRRTSRRRAHPAPSGSVSQKPQGARLARGFRSVSAGRSAWAVLHAALRHQSLVELRVAVGAHEKGNTQRVKAEQHTEGRKGVRAQRTGQRSGAGWIQTRGIDAVVVMVLRSTCRCR